MAEGTRKTVEVVRENVQEYSQEEVPLGSYAAFMTAFGAGMITFMASRGRGRARQLPERFEPGDILLMGIATHKITRIVTRDWVTSPVRAPFTSYQGSTGGGEVKEKARGSGFRRATGELLTCPWCFAPWTASALALGLATRPRTTRFVASMFTVVTISDFLQHAYQGVQRAASGGK